MFNSYLEANNALLATMGISPSPADRSDAATDRRVPLEPGAEDSPLPELAFGEQAWVTERSVGDHSDLGVGEYVRFTKRIAEADVSAFATVSGDTNRLHLENGFATETQFGGRIVHGTLVAGTISAALARLPGTTIYLSQDLEFLAPVEIGDRVTAECEILEELGEDRYRVRTTVRSAPESSSSEREDGTAADDADTDDDGGRTVIDGEAVVAIRPLPSE
nr:MaoC family dehydratase [Halobiforma nitratireducens]